MADKKMTEFVVTFMSSVTVMIPDDCDPEEYVWNNCFDELIEQAYAQGLSDEFWIERM